MKNDTKRAWYVFAFFVLFLIIAFSFLNKFPTGAASEEQGTINFTLQEAVSVRFLITNVTFGSGYVTSGTNYAILQTNGTVVNGTWTPTINYMVLENDGNVPANVSIKASDLAADFIGTGGSFQLSVSENETSSCVSDIQSAFTEITTSFNDTFICQRLNSSSTQNALNIDYKLLIPEIGAVSGARTNTITVLATQTPD